MPTSKSVCILCQDNQELTHLYGYTICNECQVDLRLLKDETIQSHFPSKKYPNKAAYENEIDDRLAFIDKEYIQKKIKLLHVKARLTQM